MRPKPDHFDKIEKMTVYFFALLCRRRGLDWLVAKFLSLRRRRLRKFISGNSQTEPAVSDLNQSLL